jgi:hypothetical protein
MTPRAINFVSAISAVVIGGVFSTYGAYVTHGRLRRVMIQSGGAVMIAGFILLYWLLYGSAGS